MTKYLAAIFTFGLVFNSILTAKSSQFEGRIIDGTGASEENSFAVRIISAESDLSPTGFLSSGVAITPYRIVTVAQAISGFGIWYVGHGSIHVAFQYETISRLAVAHPEYNEIFLHNNIGVIHIPDYISNSIPIVSRTLSSFAFGYGINAQQNLATVLQRATVFSLDVLSQCLAIFNQNVVRSDNICTAVSGSVISNGNQGGPVTNNGMTGVFGIISFWNTAGNFAVLTNLNDHIDFVTTQLII